MHKPTEKRWILRLQTYYQQRKGKQTSRRLTPLHSRPQASLACGRKCILCGGTSLNQLLCVNGYNKSFTMVAWQSAHYEIEAGRMAEVQSKNPLVRKFAQEMIRNHTRILDTLRHAAKASRLPIPAPGMSSDQARFLGGLQSALGSDFDKTYIRQQAIAHAQAVAVAESFAQGKQTRT